MFKRILDYFNKKYEKKQHLAQVEEANKIGYKEYLAQGKCVKIKAGILDVSCTLIANGSFLSLDKDFKLKSTPVVLGTFQLISDGFKIGCWNSESGKLMGYIPNDLSSGIVVSNELGSEIGSYFDIDDYRVVEVLDIDSSKEYRNSLNPDAIAIMVYWLGNIYSFDNNDILDNNSILNVRSKLK